MVAKGRKKKKKGRTKKIVQIENKYYISLKIKQLFSHFR